MAETKHQLEPTFPAKRKPDLSSEDNPQKTPKLQAPLGNSAIVSSVSQEENPILEAPERDSSSAPDDKDIKLQVDSLADAEDEDDGDDDYEDDDDNAENDRGEAEVDRKGKGDDKGKGKLMVEEEDTHDDEDDQDDDSDSGTDISNSESDLSDDPLAEVDLDNILPSRTRRRTVQPGVYVANDFGNNDDDSDDSDA